MQFHKNKAFVCFVQKNQQRTRDFYFDLTYNLKFCRLGGGRALITHVESFEPMTVDKQHKR